MTEFAICCVCLTEKSLMKTDFSEPEYAYMCFKCADELCEFRMKSDAKVIKKFLAIKRREKYDRDTKETI